MKFLIGLFIVATAITFKANASDRNNYELEIKKDYCSCVNGKSEMDNKCELFCAYAPNNSVPTLYLISNVNSENNNTSIHNLYDWCNVQLDGDTTSPQCMIVATDESKNKILLPITISGNIATANTQQLSFNKKYFLKIIEVKTGSEAESNNRMIFTRNRN